MSDSYFLLKANLLSFKVGPSSPVGKLMSMGSTFHFWTTDALDTADLFATSIPVCIASNTDESGPDKISVTVVALLPIELHHSAASGVRTSVGISFLSLSTSTLKVKKQERYFLWSPIRITLDKQERHSFIFSSIGMGATFSPPVVIINSLILPKISTQRRANCVKIVEMIPTRCS